MRVVSLVPSLTEAVAVTAPELLVGATDWCTHPAGLHVVRVGGSKYPDLGKIRELRPDLVLVNVEENRREDADQLRAGGIELHVTYPRTVGGALAELGELMRRLGVAGEPDWLREARAAWADITPMRPRRRAVIPVWRRPWIVLGSDTFAGDILHRLGVDNVYARAGERYPRPPLPELTAQGADLIVLPDEPYAFSAEDGPEAFEGTPCALASGRHLTWYGPSLAEAPAKVITSLMSTLT